MKKEKNIHKRNLISYVTSKQDTYPNKKFLGSENILYFGLRCARDSKWWRIHILNIHKWNSPKVQGRCRYYSYSYWHYSCSEHASWALNPKDLSDLCFFSSPRFSLSLFYFLWRSDVCFFKWNDLKTHPGSFSLKITPQTLCKVT